MIRKSCLPGYTCTASYLTVEVEIDHGRVLARGSERLPERGNGLLTILQPVSTPGSAPQPVRQRVTLPLIHGDGRRLINPSRRNSMPASGGIKLADANVWLAVAFSDHVHHTAAKARFEAQDDASCGFCRVTQMALLRHLTNAKIMGRFVQSQQDAWRNYDKLASDPRVVFLTERSTLEPAFRNFTQATSPSHGLWTDAFLAAFAVESQAQLVTFDQGFSRFAGLDLQILV